MLLFIDSISPSDLFFYLVVFIDGLDIIISHCTTGYGDNWDSLDSCILRLLF